MVQVSENGDKYCVRRRPYYSNSACGSGGSRVHRSEDRADVNHPQAEDITVLELTCSHHWTVCSVLHSVKRATWPEIK